MTTDTQDKLREELLPFARELCAAFADSDGNWKPAENYRAGLMDDSFKVQAALDALVNQRVSA